METLGIERADGIVTVTFCRPHKKNAINGLMWEELAAVAASIIGNPDDRCVVLTGANGDFCSGADLSDTSVVATHQLASMRRINAVVQAFHELPQPTIARVDGDAVGVGMNFALGCDLVLASDRSRFSEIFARRGLSLDGGGSWILPRLVGLHKAKELALFGEIIPAVEALRLGIVNRVVSVEALDPLVADWAGRLAAGPPIALAMTKRMLNRSFEQSFEQALDDEARSQTINFSTRDTAEAIGAFLAKREPRFEGR